MESRIQLSVSLSLSQTQTIAADSVANASDDLSHWESEMSVSVNPKNPLQLAGISYNSYSASNNEVEVFYSADGGATWNGHLIDGRPVSSGGDGLGNGFRFDPILTFDEEGRLFVAYGFAVSGNTSLIVGRSPNGGETFDHFDTADSVSGSGIHIDKWFMATGQDPVSGDTAIYIAYSSFAGGSLHIAAVGCNDLGATQFHFFGPVTVGTAGFGETFACPAVGPNGELYVSWYDAGDIAGQNTHNIYFNRDIDGLWGTTHTFATTDFEVHTLANGRLRGYTEQFAQRDRGINTAPVLTADRRAGSAGRLYLTFVELADEIPSQDTNVMFGYGELDTQTNTVDWTFSTVDSSTGTEFNPWVDVDQATGSVHILYYTTDGDQNDGNEDVKMRLATSLDGGSTWTLADITTVTSDEYENGNNTEDFYGDYLEYIGLDVHQGTAHGFFAFEPSNTGSARFDLEAMHVDAAFVNSNNTLTIDGTSGNDTIVVQKHASNNNYLQVVVNSVTEFVGRLATIGRIVINGGNGNDTITVNSTITIPTTIEGGAGADSISGGGGDDVINGGSGVDTLLPGAGDDTADYSTFTSAVTINLAQGPFGPNGEQDYVPNPHDFENAIGGSGNDVITGWTNANFLDGRGGNDTIDGDDNGGQSSPGPDGYDSILGGDGNDYILGDGGDDTIDGQAGNDFINGGAGHDQITGGAGNDSLYGDAGNDTLFAADGEVDFLSGGSGTDTAFADKEDEDDETIENLIT